MMAIGFLFIAFLSGVFITFLQPLVGKMVLPIFGGTALTWNSIMMLFSGFTFVTALIALILMRTVPQRTQAMVQSAICLACVAIMGLMGITPEQSDQSLLRQMLILGLKIAPVIFLGWGTVFLIHSWQKYHAFLRERPLLIFATAYFGSAFGLFLFHLFEPHSGVSDLIFFVRVGTICLAVLVLLALYPIARSEKETTIFLQAERSQKLPWLSWVLISFATSSLLLGFTHLAGSEFASSTFIWIVPMGLFALSLFLAFLRPQLIPSAPLFMAVLMTAIPIIMLEIFSENIPTMTSVLLHGAFFTVAVMFLHKHLGLLAVQSNLGPFFVCFTLGQFLAAFLSVVAPLIFKDYLEYPLSIALAVALATHFWSQSKNIRFLWRDFGWISLVVPFAALCSLVWYITSSTEKLSTQNMLLVSALIASSLVLLARSQLFLFVGLSGLIIAPHLVPDKSIMFSDRSFYGVSQVQSWKDYRLYTNGTTIHGAEPLKEIRPITYYAEEGPVGHFFQAMSAYTAQHPAAVLGLGTGSIVQYMAPEQQVDFYEIDGLVEKIAKTYFSFLKNTASKVNVKIGDGRVEIQKAPDNYYGFILLDAFSSDAIPSHLLTKEAFQIYVKKLKPDGVILLNIANRYLDLYPVLQALASELNLSIARGRSAFEDKEKLIYPSEWVAFSQQPERLVALSHTKIWETDKLDNVSLKAWKDDFIDLSDVLRK